MTTPAFSRWVAVVACAGAIAAGLPTPLLAADGNKACGLLTPSELESALGDRVSLSAGNAGDVQLCTGETPAARVLLRLFKRAGDPSGAREKAGLEAARKMGAQVEVKTFGPITCSAVVPPASLAQHGFNTTCSVSKPPMFAVVEVTAKSQKDMVPIDRLRPLAEKMAGRL